MLEEAFRTIYEQESKTEQSRVAAEDELYAYQTQWCEKFKNNFLFISQYGGLIEIDTASDFDVKLFKRPKSRVYVRSRNYVYSLQITPPAPNTDKCSCFEHYHFEHPVYLELTLPEITKHISKGLAASNADHTLKSDEKVRRKTSKPRNK